MSASATQDASMKSPEKPIPGPEMESSSQDMAKAFTAESKELRVINNKRQKLSDLFTIVQPHNF
jgi:hypothetical protein